MNIYVNREIWADSFSVYIRRGSGLYGSTRSIAQPIQFRVLEPKDEGTVAEPTMLITQQEAQEFIDSLWNAGLRPTEGSGSAGSLAATQRHLDDMRHIVFKANPLITK